ncbi:MAG: helix-turn-helix transcriptional regulator [Alphaproteobacteria bacterium]
MENQTDKQPDKLMTPKEVAAYLRVSEGMLYDYRAMGIGPNYIKLGKERLVRYCQSDVDTWLAKQKIELAENKEK